MTNQKTQPAGNRNKRKAMIAVLFLLAGMIVLVVVKSFAFEDIEANSGFTIGWIETYKNVNQMEDSNRSIRYGYEVDGVTYYRNVQTDQEFSECNQEVG